MLDLEPIRAHAAANSPYGPELGPSPAARGVPRLQTLAAVAALDRDDAGLDALRCAAQSLREFGRQEALTLPPERLARLALQRPRLLARGLREGWWDTPRRPPLPPLEEELLPIDYQTSPEAEAIVARRPEAETTLHHIGSLLAHLAATPGEHAAALRARLLRRAATTVARLVAPALRAAPPAQALFRAEYPAADASEAEVEAIRWRMNIWSTQTFGVLVGLRRANFVLDDICICLTAAGDPLQGHIEAVFGRTQDRCMVAEETFRAVCDACEECRTACNERFPYVDNLEEMLDALLLAGG